MGEGHESQELAIPIKRKGGIAQRVRNMLTKPAVQTITKTPQPIEKTPIGQASGEMDIEAREMSVERAREILEYIVGIDEHGLDAHERKLTPAEQLKRFGGIHYEDIKKAFGIYANHLITTHGAKDPSESYSYKLIKKDLPGAPYYYEGSPQKRYYSLRLSILLDLFDRPKVPKAVNLELYDGYGGPLRIESNIPLVDVKPDSSDERSVGFSDDLSLSRPINPKFNTRIPEYATLLGLRLFAKETYRPEEFHREYKGLWRGMRWTAANLLCWDENRIVFPDDLDKSPSPLDKGQAQLSKPRLELPPKQ